MRTFPVIDGDRDFGPTLDRRIVEEYGGVDVVVVDMGQWSTLPARATRSAAGDVFELGPYDLIPEDARALCEALGSFLKAVAS